MIYLIIILAVLVIYFIGFFNKLQTFKVRIKASIQEIGNQLKRQADLIPNLIESTKGYLKHEKSIFNDLTDARKSILQAASSSNAKKMDQAQAQMSKALGALQVVVESNPEIKASTVITDLMEELRDTADKLMYSRRTLIDLTADYNTTISTIPGVWFAPMFGFTSEAGLSTPTDGKFLQVSDTDTTTPKVDLN